MRFLDQDLRTVPIAVLDFEMTGLDPQRDRVCEVAVVRGTAGGITGEFQSLVRPRVKVSKGARKVHGLTDAMLSRAPGFRRVAPDLVEALAGAVVVCHNVPFDIGFLHRELDEVGVPFDPPLTLDTLQMARRLFAFRRNDLRTVCQALGVAHEDQHRALGDARATWGVFREMVGILAPEGGARVADLVELLGALAPNSPQRLAWKRELAGAFRERRTVHIDYQSTADPRRGAIRREIAIWALALPYIQAWCYLRTGERVFRFDRIQRVAPGARSYDIPTFERRI